jgi:5-(carboxyamino)imidazole ribonucleotide synthase
MPDAPLPPGSTIGVLGGGQLGRMLAIEAARLGLKTHIYCDEANAPAFDVAAQSTVGSYADRGTLAHFAGAVDVVTCEFENVPAETLETVARGAPVFPSAKSFAVAQDRLAEKDFIRALDIAVAPYTSVTSLADLRAAMHTMRPPALLKTRRFGYDGKGQILIRDEAEAESAWAAIGRLPAVLESLMRFEREVSVIVVRDRDGAVKFYDLVENVHDNGILAVSRVPARISQSSGFAARTIAGRIAEALGHVGVLAVEMFERGSDRPDLIVNEIAPRVHNSGHWTLDGCVVSQFENHMRAICGWPLGETARHSDAIMTNLIGADVERWRELARENGAAVHIYGKAEARAGRKMGHVTRLFPKS